MLSINRDAWNEQELALHFIGPILGLVHFTEPYRFNLFDERRIGAIVSSDSGDIELSGEPDGIIATGYREPEIPFFAFTEYKRQLDPNGDPVGQTLAAMLVAQRLNEERQPIYGAYIVGTDWRFMMLEGQYYVISRDYSALSIVRSHEDRRNLMIPSLENQPCSKFHGMAETLSKRVIRFTNSIRLSRRAPSRMMIPKKKRPIKEPLVSHQSFDGALVLYG